MLACDLRLHTETVWPHTRESIVAGPATGLLQGGDLVTFEATHFLIRQRLTARVTEYVAPYRFVDEMISGAFRTLRHTHAFEVCGERTMMTDTLELSAPLGILGWLAERVVLRSYMEAFLIYRNRKLKAEAERRAKQQMNTLLFDNRPKQVRKE
ncbi:SRPBCC family protein [Paenibacillus puerhi]|uniref:SRPBCC family protein n=1 Tax=Paenibacillus puerhi TaxID=2692622 RepID=UPI001F37ACF2|nr:SRPBCC family protein [Paenibacillus puerhi]